MSNLNFLKKTILSLRINYVSKIKDTRNSYQCQLIVRRYSNPVQAYNASIGRKSRKESADILKWILLVIPVTSFGLGCWQVQRRQWKLDLIRQMQLKANMAPNELPEDIKELDELEYTPVKVKGTFLYDQEILIGPRSLIVSESAETRAGSLISDPRTNQGWLVVTPFRLSDRDMTILVNRGWVPHKMKSAETRQNSMVMGEIELVGVVRLTETRAPFMPKNIAQKGQWFYRDLNEMSSHLGCSPVWLDVRGISQPPKGWPIPNQTRVSLRNEHLSYLVTWYSLSFLTTLMWYRVFIRKLPLL